MVQVRCIFLILTLYLGVTVTTYAQSPPEPNKQQSDRRGPPCDKFDDDGPGQGQGVPPPPGLCLPIDDYVYLLMAVGVMYGCYKVRKFEIA
ncbi:hypothetical protein [Christiangramia echinicola]|uniref:Uncharacterized protein n=1 Tax=Christiangramia echinicola TaxID=279359 RepID=A0A1H1MWA3_9FLAO|nr:hypothetical protein [Christiangramia echinicola]SDR90882.1 hypothetical protein SAMN04488552_1474 [Christiangramia echinicola]